MAEDNTDAPAAAPALKDIFDATRIRHIAKETAAVHPGFDARRFTKDCLHGLEAMSLMARMRHVAVCLHTSLPPGYRQALAVLRLLAPRLNHGFVTLVLSEYVALYGADDVKASLEALKFFTPFGSAEFAIRPFLQHDLHGTLKVMERWSHDADEHVRRLASEGCRPRLPWAQRLPALVADPAPALPILQNLRADPSPYVRKSVANHLNDIAKDHPALVMELLEAWPAEDDPHTRWIIRHALRTLIKKGDRHALALVGAGHQAEVRLRDVVVAPAAVRLGDSITLSFTVESTAATAQRLVVDYAVHYVKKSGVASPKVFKLKTLELPAGATQALSRRQLIKDFSTRTHHAGRHAVDVVVNGECLGQAFFDLKQ